MGKRLCDYILGPTASLINIGVNIAKEILFEKSIPVDLEDLTNIEKLNSQQKKKAYDAIMNAVLSSNNIAFFVDRPGGTGKTFLYRSVLATVRSKGYVALATAISGVAASILLGGRNAHSRFKLHLHDDTATLSTISKQSAIAKLILEVKLIIWDEATMSNRHAVETFNQMLQDITDKKDILFGGKVVVLGGDFRQVLLVVKKGSREAQIKASLVSSTIWNNLTHIRLTENMRARTYAPFRDFLIRIGDGTIREDENGNISLPSSMLIPYTDKEESLKQLISCVYPDIGSFAIKSSRVMNRVMLAPTNEYVDDINDIVLGKIAGEIVTYTSTNITLDPQYQSDYEDFLNPLNPSNLPQHQLSLKINCPVMLLRNLAAVEGFCNGTRLICKELNPTTIKLEIATGPFTGKPIILHKIPLQSSDDYTIGIPFKRCQFPIRLCFAMTITNPKDRLSTLLAYIYANQFSHRQLYIALYRVRTGSTFKAIVVPSTFSSKETRTATRNVVFQEVLAKSRNCLTNV